MGRLDTKPKFFRAWLQDFWTSLKLRRWDAAWELIKTLIEQLLK